MAGQQKGDHRGDSWINQCLNAKEIMNQPSADLFSTALPATQIPEKEILVSFEFEIRRQSP
jgi:hypothetical protein